MSYQPSAPLGSIVIQEAEDELIVYDSRSQRAHCLNSTAASVLRLCDGSRTASEIASQLPREHDLPVDEAVVWLALDGLFKAGLLMEPVPARNTGVSRRAAASAVMRAAIVLPVIYSILVPTPASAGS